MRVQTHHAHDKTQLAKQPGRPLRPIHQRLGNGVRHFLGIAAFRRQARFVIGILADRQTSQGKALRPAFGSNFLIP